MILSAASPKDVLSWFESGQSGADILCLLLAPSKADRDKIRETFENFFEYDALMGKKIDFIVFYPKMTEPTAIAGEMGRVEVFPGEQLFRPLRDAYFDFKDHFYGGEASRLVAERMARFVPELMQLIGVHHDELPALCVLVQGISAIQTIKLDSTWDEDELRGWMKDLATTAYRTSSKRYSEFDGYFILQRIKRATGEADSMERAIEARKRALEKTFRLLSNKNHFDQDQLVAVAKFLNSKEITPPTLETLLQQLPIDEANNAHNRSRVAYVRKAVLEMEDYERRLKETIEAIEAPEITLPALQEYFEKRNQETMDLLESLASKHNRKVTVRLMRRNFADVESVAESAERLSSLVKKFAWLGTPIKRIAQGFGVHWPG